MNKTLHYLCAALLGAGMLHTTPPLCAQEGTDVTDKYLQNAGFDNNPTATDESWAGTERMYLPESWTLTNSIGSWGRCITVNYGITFSSLPDVFNSVQPPASDINEESNGAVFMMSGSWGSTIQLGQAVTLPGGKYELQYEVINQYTDGNIQANYFGFVPDSGTAVYDTETSFSDSWQRRTVSFTIEEENTEGYISIGLLGNSNGASSNGKLAVDNIRLIYYGVDKTELDSLIAEATGLYEANSSADGASDFYSAIQAAQEVSDDVNATQSGVAGAIAALQEAIAQFRFGIASEENPLDMSSLIANAGFETNSGDRDQTFTGWTKTGTSSSEFCIRTNREDEFEDYGDGTAYLQYWVSSTSTVPDFSVTQELTGLPQGIYELTAAGRYGGDGFYLVANEERTAIGELGDYTVRALVTEEGTLTIGVVAENGTSNFPRADYFRLAYLGNNAEDLKPYYQELMDEAQSLAGEKMQGTVLDTLNAAITAFEEASTPEGLEEAIEELKAAIESAQASIEVYSAFKAVIDSYAPENYLGGLPEVLTGAVSAAGEAYEAAEKDDFSEEIAALKAAHDEVSPSLIISGDMTRFIIEADMTIEDMDASAWKLETSLDGDWQTLDVSGGQYLGMDGTALEHWNDRYDGSKRNITIYQAVTDVPNGVYTLSCAAFAVYEEANSSSQDKTGVVFYANGVETAVPITWSTPNSQIYTVENVRVTDGTLEVGLKATGAYCNWLVIDNVVLTKTNQTLVLDDQEPFDATVDAATSASYTRAAFSNGEDSTANYENSRGWQTICLPYDVESITSVKDGSTITLLPVTDGSFDDGVDDTDEANAHPFWLYAIDEDGDLSPATEIKANVPYLMLVPNDEEYYEAFYNIPGDITFTGSAIAATDLQEQAGSEYNLTGYFGGASDSLPAADGKTYYALNKEGSEFVQDSIQAIASFQAFATVDQDPQSAPQTLSIINAGDGTITALPGIEEALADRTQDITVYTADGGLRIESAKDCTVNVYSIDGMLLQSVRVSAGGSEFVALPAGKYVANGKVVIAQ